MVTLENFISSRMDRSPPSNGLFFFGQKLSRRKKTTNLPKLSFFSSSPFFPVALSFPTFVSVIFELLRRKNLPFDPFPLKWQNISLGQKIDLIYRRKNYSKSGIYVYNSLVFESEKNVQNKEKRATLNLATSHFTTNYVWKKAVSYKSWTKDLRYWDLRLKRKRFERI